MAYSPRRRIDGPMVVAAVLSPIVLSYVATRAAKLCITIDEASTYNCHVTGGWLDIILFRTDGLPDNNHVLYTLLCKASVMLFGLSELTLRMPSLLGCLFYLLGLNLCLRRIASGWKIVPGLLAVGLNPYVIDFLGLARGYGLGLGFTMLGLAALLSSFTETTGKPRVVAAQVSMVLFGFAALSNLSFLLVLCAAMILFGAYLVYSGIIDRRDSGSPFTPWLILLLRISLPAIPFIAYLALPIGIIRQKNPEGGSNRHPLIQQGDSPSADLRVHPGLGRDSARQRDKRHQRPHRRPSGCHRHAEGADRRVVRHDRKREEVQHDYHPSP